MDARKNWYIKNLGDALLAGDELEKIKMLFRQEYASSPSPGGKAIFIRHESEGQLHCDVKLYFTPATVKLANAVNAQPCKQPSGQDLGLFAGDETAWAVLECDKP